MKTFWSSKTFWTAVIGFLAVVLNGTLGWNISNEIIVGIMSLLTIIFRWPSEQKLSIRRK